MRLSIEPAASFAGAPPPAGTRLLAFEMAPQQRENWCWAAIAAAVAHQAGGEVSQALVVQLMLGLADGIDPADLPDVAARLDQALDAVGCYDHWSPGRAAPARVTEEIDAGRPVALRLRGRDGGSHFVLITGYFDHGRTVRIDDPRHGRSLQEFAGFPAVYRGMQAVWMETYWIRSYRRGDGCPQRETKLSIDASAVQHDVIVY